jgi:hypothetical protein
MIYEPNVGIRLDTHHTSTEEDAFYAPTTLAAPPRERKAKPKRTARPEKKGTPARQARRRKKQ